MEKLYLDGKWSLSFFKQGEYNIKSYDDIKNFNIETIDATVPGNVELDLIKKGYLPEDIFFADNILKAEEYENYEWWYYKEFDGNEFKNKKCRITFDGVDVFATYYLNGELLGKSENALIPQVFECNIKEKNTLCVRIESTMLTAAKKDYTMADMCHFFVTGTTPAELYTRKPSHSFGWDILPRSVSAGIFRSVYIEEIKEFEVKQLCYAAPHTRNYIRVLYEVNTMPEGCEFEVYGKCKDNEFYRIKKADFRCGRFDIPIKDLLLWWPRGYGEQNLYDITFRMKKDGNVLCEKTIKAGIRKAKLLFSETTDGQNGQFVFEINGVKVYTLGVNWSAMHPYHSLDKTNKKEMLDILLDSGSNMVRIWGGSVYEEDDFFDFCDENGIMVWNDFAFSCDVYPQSEEFLKVVKEEAECIIKKLRNHPSIVLWAGDNECDLAYVGRGINPVHNKINRQVLLDAVNMHDPYTAYLPSSPYISQEVFKSGRTIPMPEDHLWGIRDDYKGDYIKNTKSHFVSETGWYGSPSLKSIKKFLSEDAIALWPDKIYENNEWILHSSDQLNNPYRVHFLTDAVMQSFGYIPEKIEDFVTASQIAHAEGTKFIIENFRYTRPTKTGILIWNLFDGWPVFTEGLVDYFMDKKPAYYYLKQAHQPILIMLKEWSNFGMTVVVDNCTLKDEKGTYEIMDVETGEILMQGEFESKANQNTVLGRLTKINRPDKKMLSIKWKTKNYEGKNHYLCGQYPIDAKKYTEWQKKLCSLGHFEGMNI